MRPAIIIALLGVAQPAHAACHKFSVWRYPWPQRCEAAAHDAPKLVAHSSVPYPPRPADHVGDIPLPDLSGVWMQPLDTPETLELYGQIQRLKALRQITLE